MYIKMFLNFQISWKGDVLLRNEILLKVICEKVQFSNCDLCDIFVTMNDILTNYSKILKINSGKFYNLEARPGVLRGDFVMWPAPH